MPFASMAACPRNTSARAPLLMSTRWRNGSRSTRTISATSERCTARGELSRTARRRRFSSSSESNRRSLRRSTRLSAASLTFSASTRVLVAKDSRIASKACTGACTVHWIGYASDATPSRIIARWCWRWSATMRPAAMAARTMRRSPRAGPPRRRGRGSESCDVTWPLSEAEQPRVLFGQLEDPAAAARDAGQRVLGDDHRQAGFFHEQLVDVLEQRAAAGQHDAAVGDVGAELRWRLLERLLDRLHDALEGLLHGLEDLVRVQREAARHALGEVAALDGHLAHLLSRVGRADHDAVVAAHVVGDRLVEAVAADSHRFRVDDAVQRDDGDLGCAAADVEHHGAARLVDRQAGADRGRHWFRDHVDAARARALRRLLDRALLDLRGTEGHADQHARRRTQPAVTVHLGDEVLQHPLGVSEVGDDAVLHRPDRRDVPRRATEHVLGLGADGDDDLAAATRLVLDRDHRRFVEDDALAADVDEHVRRAEVDGDVAREVTPEVLEHGGTDLGAH